MVSFRRKKLRFEKLWISCCLLKTRRCTTQVLPIDKIKDNYYHLIFPLMERNQEAWVMMLWNFVPVVLELKREREMTPIVGWCEWEMLDPWSKSPTGLLNIMMELIWVSKCTKLNASYYSIVYFVSTTAEWNCYMELCALDKPHMTKKILYGPSVS
jgi:hypothetical protein